MERDKQHTKMGLIKYQRVAVYHGSSSGLPSGEGESNRHSEATVSGFLLHSSVHACVHACADPISCPGQRHYLHVTGEEVEV